MQPPHDPFVCGGNWYAAAIYGDGHWVVELDPTAVQPALDPTVDGPACSGAVALITQNVFENNFVAVMPYFHTRLIVSNNIFRDNAFAFAANALQDRGVLLHNVFWNNERIAVGISAGYVDVLDNVIGASSTGYWQDYVQQGRLACNVFWQNDADIAPGIAGEPLRLTLGTVGNVVTDPLFVDVASGDFHLGPGSPAIDSGCNVDGTLDPDGSPVDIGAYGGPLGDW